MDMRLFAGNLSALREIGADRRHISAADAYYKQHTPADSRVLKVASVATALALILAASAANAAVDLIKVPAMCGTSTEVLNALAVKMPNPEAIGKGGDGRGKDIATLFTGNGYWALLALMSSDSVCVVASGRNWTVTEPEEAPSY